MHPLGGSLPPVSPLCPRRLPCPRAPSPARRLVGGAGRPAGGPRRQTGRLPCRRHRPLPQPPAAYPRGAARPGRGRRWGGGWRWPARPATLVSSSAPPAAAARGRAGWGKGAQRVFAPLPPALLELGCLPHATPHWLHAAAAVAAAPPRTGRGGALSMGSCSCGRSRWPFPLTLFFIRTAVGEGKGWRRGRGGEAVA